MEAPLTPGASAPANSRRSSWINPKLLVVGIAILIAVGYLIFNAMQGSAASYFVTTSELQQQSAKMDGQRVRVGGNVLPGSIQKGDPGQPIQFVVSDGTTQFPVVYTGVLPDIFADNTQVVVEGTYHANGAFQADTLLTKCPSKFSTQ